MKSCSGQKRRIRLNSSEWQKHENFMSNMQSLSSSNNIKKDDGVPTFSQLFLCSHFFLYDLTKGNSFIRIYMSWPVYMWALFSSNFADTHHSPDTEFNVNSYIVHMHTNTTTSTKIKNKHKIMLSKIRYTVAEDRQLSWLTNG